MVVANEGLALLEELHLADDPLPHLRVLLDYIGLLIGQLSRFSQDLLADHNLPHIME